MFFKKNFFLICSSFLFIGRHTLSGTQCLQQPPRKDVTFEEFVKSYYFIFMMKFVINIGLQEGRKCPHTTSIQGVIGFLWATFFPGLSAKRHPHKNDANVK